ARVRRPRRRYPRRGLPRPRSRNRRCAPDLRPGRRHPLHHAASALHARGSALMSAVDVVEASIAELQEALRTGRTTAVGLVDAYPAGSDAYDGPATPTALNAVVVRNPAARAEAVASDARRARGELLGPLDGNPYTAKDSYL